MLQEIPLKERILRWKTLKMFFILLAIYIDRYLYGYLSLHIGDNGDSLEVFYLFSMFLKDKSFK